MTNIKINESTQSPEILFDFEKAEISISGKSYPENVNDTYKELIAAINIYRENPQKETTINFNWLYYNTATSKIIIKILLDLKTTNTKLNVNWVVKKDFEMMIEKAKLISEVMDIEVNIILE
jgi:hypothetical protein